MIDFPELQPPQPEGKSTFLPPEVPITPPEVPQSTPTSDRIPQIIEAKIIQGEKLTTDEFGDMLKSLFPEETTKDLKVGIKPPIKRTDSPRLQINGLAFDLSQINPLLGVVSDRSKSVLEDAQEMEGKLILNTVSLQNDIDHIGRVKLTDNGLDFRVTFSDGNRNAVAEVALSREKFPQIVPHEMLLLPLVSAIVTDRKLSDTLLTYIPQEVQMVIDDNGITLTLPDTLKNRMTASSKSPAAPIAPGDPTIPIALPVLDGSPILEEPIETAATPELVELPGELTTQKETNGIINGKAIRALFEQDFPHMRWKTETEDGADVRVNIVNGIPAIVLTNFEIKGPLFESPVAKEILDQTGITFHEFLLSVLPKSSASTEGTIHIDRLVIVNKKGPKAAIDEVEVLGDLTQVRALDAQGKPMTINGKVITAGINALRHEHITGSLSRSLHTQRAINNVEDSKQATRVGLIISTDEKEPESGAVILTVRPKK